MEGFVKPLVGDSDYKACSDDCGEVQPGRLKEAHQEQIKADHNRNERGKDKQSVILPSFPVGIGTQTTWWVKSVMSHVGTM